MKKRFLAMFIVFVMLFSQVSVFATDIDQFSVLDESGLSTVADDSESVYSNSNLSELIVLEEITELREANVKHFRLSNGINKAVSYSQPVHYMDESGSWIDIDNSLSLQGNEYSTNNKFEIKFANKSGSSGLLSIKDGDYKIDFTPLNTNKVNVVIENPQENNSRKFNDVKALRNLVSRATYSNIYNGIDIEYILTGNNIKENIIVNSKQDSYVYSFELKLNKLTAELSNGSIILSDNTTGENMYVIPAPYMYDANGVTSRDVEYSLVQNSKWKYTFTVTASTEWINAADRAFPVAIDPTIIADNVDYDTYVMLDGYDYTTSNSLVVGNFFGMFKDVPGFMKFNTLPEIQPGTHLVQAKVTMHISYLENTNNVDFYLGVFRAQRDWVTNGFADVFQAVEAYENNSTEANYDNYVNILQSYFASSPESSVQVLSDGPYEWDITSLYKDWKNGTANNGICIKAVGLPENENANVRISTIESAASNNTPPQIELTYAEPKGIDDAFALENTTLGTVGNSYVNLFNGNLTYINNLTTIENQVLPYEINMVYNSVDNAWTASFDEKITLFENPNDIMGDNIERYLWHDADGTIHYFTPYLQKNWWGGYVQYEEASNGYLWATNDPVVFYPEDDIDYVLTKTTDGDFILKNYDGTQKYFDSTGKLLKICDAQGNVLFLSYEAGNVSCIDYVTSDNIQIPQAEFTYDINNKLLTVHNFVTNSEVSLTWNNNVLSAIEYNDTDNTKDNTITINYFENSTTIENITDDLESEYIQYIFNSNGTISSVQIYNDDNILQSQYDMAYNSDNAVCTDLGANLSSSADNVRQKYVFDEKGRKITLSKSEGNSNTYTLVHSWTYNDDILPDDVYYTVSYSNNINKKLDVVGNETSLVRYDINTKQEMFISISELHSFSTDNTSTSNASLNMDAIVENIVLDYDNTLMPMDIIGEDTRQHISDESVSQDPYNSICFLRSFYNGDSYRGTGFLIGPNVLLTAAHNVFSDNTSDKVTNPTFAESIHVYVAAQTNLNNSGQYVPESPYGVIEVEEFYLQQTYCNLSRNNSKDSFNYDWAICILETDIGNQVGWFDISIPPSNTNNSEISIIGYPGDKEKEEKYDMFLSNGSVTAVGDYTFSYDADTFGGNSGSPVFINNGSFIVIGIHVKGFNETDDDTSNDFNGATKISSLICTVSAVLKSVDN